MEGSSKADQGSFRPVQHPLKSEVVRPPSVVATPEGDLPSQTMSVPGMQSGPYSVSTTIAQPLSVDPVPSAKLFALDVVTLIGLAKSPAIAAQEKMLGGLPSDTLRAFAHRLQILPGLTQTARTGAYQWLRGNAWTGPTGVAIGAALGHLVDVKRTSIINFDMKPMDIRLEDIYCGAHYGLRGISIATNPSDIAVLPDDLPQVGIDAVVRARRLAGLPIPQIMKESEFVANRRELEREFGPVEMFMRDAAHSDKRSVRWAKVLNNKLDGVAICQALGVPVPLTYHNGIAGKLDYNRIPPNTQLILKAEYSAGGSGVKLVKDVDDLKQRVGALQPTDRIQVQKWVPGEDISFLFHCGPDGATLISSSTQEMEGGVSHVGNAIPGDRSRIRDSYADAMKPFADFAQRMGFRGHLGIDARISALDDEVDFIECNPRRTAVSTPTVIATQLGFPEFCHRQMVFKDRESLDKVLERFSYKSGSDRGVVITTYLGEPGKKYKSEFVFLDRGTDGQAYRDSIIAWATQMGYMYAEH